MDYNDTILDIARKLEESAALVREQMKTPDTSPATEAYRSRAREQYGRDGECEIDDGAVVSYGGGPGAYVQAWVWVSAQDAGVCCGCGEIREELDDDGKCEECAGA